VIEMDGTSVVGAAGPGVRRLPEAGQVGFADLVWADPVWVRAEFDAIIAANFGATAGQPSVPSRRPPRPAGERRGRPGDADRTHSPSGGFVHGDLAWTARQVGARERSPPLRARDCARRHRARHPVNPFGVTSRQRR
jgi:hypothetical protein